MVNSPGRRRVALLRWSVFAVVSAVNAIAQFYWICYSAVSHLAEAYFRVSGWSIGVLAMVYMACYLLFSLPASWVIDRYGHTKAVFVAVLITALAGIGRGLAGDHYGGVLACTVVLAAAQPFILNSWIVYVHKWFPVRRYSVAFGMLTASNLMGVLLGLIVPAMLVTSQTLSWLSKVQIWAGAFGLVFALVYWFAVSEAAPDASKEIPTERMVSWEGMRNALRERTFVFSCVGIYLGMGAFTGVLQWMGEILLPYGLDGLDAALLGSSLLLLGSVASVVGGFFSDKVEREVPFFVGGFFVAAIGCLVLAYSLEFVDLAIGAALVGIGLISLMPIVLSYASKVAWPSSEGTTNGLLQLAAQASVSFVGLMYVMKTSEGLYWIALLLTAMLLMTWGIVMALLPESREVVAIKRAQAAEIASAQGEPLASPTPHTPR